MPGVPTQGTLGDVCSDDLLMIGVNEYAIIHNIDPFPGHYSTFPISCQANSPCNQEPSPSDEECSNPKPFGKSTPGVDPILLLLR